MNLHELQLTETDFNLLIEGLDELPNKGMTGFFLGELLEGMFSDKLPPDSAHRIKTEREDRERQRQAAIDARKDDIAILKGKLAMLKRWMQTEGILKSVDDIVNPKNNI